MLWKKKSSTCLNIPAVFFKSNFYCTSSIKRKHANRYCIHTCFFSEVCVLEDNCCCLFNEKQERWGGSGLAKGKGRTGLTIKDECKRIPVEKEALKKTSPRTCEARQNWQFFNLMNPRPASPHHPLMPRQMRTSTEQQNASTLFISWSFN